jgi:hypothetical protein
MRTNPPCTVLERAAYRASASSSVTPSMARLAPALTAQLARFRRVYVEMRSTEPARREHE